MVSKSIGSTGFRGIVPERDRRCILEDDLVGDDLGAAIVLDGGDADDIVDCRIHVK